MNYELRDIHAGIQTKQDAHCVPQEQWEFTDEGWFFISTKTDEVPHPKIYRVTISTKRIQQEREPPEKFQ